MLMRSGAKFVDVDGIRHKTFDVDEIRRITFNDVDEIRRRTF